MMPMLTQTALITELPANSCPLWERGLDGLRVAIVVWLLLVGLWSGPAYGSTLAYPNGLPAVEIVLAIVLALLALRGRVRPAWEYPCAWPCLAVLVLCALTAALRMWLRQLPFDTLRLWQNGEPMLRGLLLYLAIAGHTRLARIAWVSMLVGVALSSVATVIQYCTGVVRWYTNLDVGYKDGVHAVSINTLRDKDGTLDVRAQGLTSYINLTASISAAALPYWLLPPLLRVPLSSRARVLLVLGGLTTATALWFTGSRGPLFALLIVAAVFLWRLQRRWGISALVGLCCFILGMVSAVPLWVLGILLLATLLVCWMNTRQRLFFLAAALGLGLTGSVRVVTVYLLHYAPSKRMGKGIGDWERTPIYRDALEAIQIAPWWGIGDEAISERERQLAAHHLMGPLPRTQQNVHDQYLQWIAAEGLPVALGYMLLTLWATWWCWRHGRLWRSPFARALALAGAAGLAIFLFTNLADAFFWRIEGGGFFWSVFAVTAAVGTMVEETAETTEVTARHSE